MNVLSLFDGMSCGRLALERYGIEVNKYYASEISTVKMQASKNYFPDNIYIGDVTEIGIKKRGTDFLIWNRKNTNSIGYSEGGIDLLIGGSPCQGFSIMGNRLNFKDTRSGLIMEYFRILNEIRQYNPDVKFILENVPMDKTCEIEVSRRLGVLPVKINSSLVSAQNRKRNYWTNIPGSGADLFSDEIEQPKDKKIFMKDILQPESEVDEKYYLKGKKFDQVIKGIIEKKEKYHKLNGFKSRALQEGYGNRWNGTFILKQDQFINKKQNGSGYKINPKKSYTLNTVDKQSIIKDFKSLRQLTPKECCRLQTIPDDFFEGSEISDNQQYSCLGDGWTIDVICHILQGLKL